MNRTRTVADYTLGSSASIRDAMKLIDRNGLEIAVLVDNGLLVGVLTDGDLRHAILDGAALDDPALARATRNPTTVPEGTNRAHALDVMRATRLEQIPVIDGDGRVIGMHTLSDIVGHPVLDNVAVVMAGGRGVRLGELTQHTPKPLVPIAGRPIIEWVLLNLISGGIRTFYISVNYLADQIIERLGDGSSIGATIHYIHEDAETPLGTAGSLALIDRAELPDAPLVVTNADLMVQFDVGEFIDSHVAMGSAVTVATRRYEHQVPFGVVERGSDRHIAQLVEKPVLDVETNAGIYVVSPDALGFVPSGRPSTMPELVETCIQRGLTVGAWSMESDWIDVGTPRDLARARGNQ
ncbi:sugar phosphate nucleotidyltransferase [Humibacter sp. RRB41]|uniref:sugar phosphate nucleotidyltransferase n=1 Tax=Humibacter sp. RRB41 TaxID=2919946 RepID=UPI00242FF244|nr:sugar phosphate nucleotidyltransferase [Humibacter sp. RRB41]